MHHRLQLNFPFCGGLMLGLVFTVLFVFIAISQHSGEQRFRRDIKSMRVDEPDSDQLSQPSTHPANSHQEIDTSSVRNGIIFVDNRGKETSSHSLLIDRDSTGFDKDDLLQTVVFTGNTEVKTDTAAEMTWAAGRKDVIVKHVGSGIAGYEHTLMSGLQSICDRKIKHRWYLLIQDSVYVHMDVLLETIGAFPHRDKLVLGVPKQDEAQHCSSEVGILLSQAAMRTVCVHVADCPSVDEEHGDAIDQCIGQISGAYCTDITKISNLNVIPRASLELLQSKSTDLNKVLYVGPLAQKDDLYRLHLMFTERKIAAVQQYMFHLSEQMTPDSLQRVRPKRNSDQSNLEQSVLVSHGSMLNSTIESFYEYFDRSGTVYPQSCEIQKDSLNNSKAFLTSSALAYDHFKDRVGKELDDTTSFGYKITKPNSGVEYQFYLIDKHKQGSHHGGDRVYQTIVEQPFSNIQIDDKTFQVPEDVTIVTMADDLSRLENLLYTLVHSCQGIIRSKAKCAILVLYEDILLSRESNQELEDIIESIDKARVSISSLHIKTDEYDIMNNFQKALVKGTIYDESLLVFHHPKSRISEQFLWRCQVNTIAGSSAYFPIPFQYIKQTGEGVLRRVISSKTGFWKSADFDTFCAHTKDLQKLSILPKSPKMLFQLISSVLTLRRIPDSGVWREWDDSICPDTDTRHSCIEDLMYRNM